MESDGFICTPTFTIYVDGIWWTEMDFDRFRFFVVVGCRKETVSRYVGFTRQNSGLPTTTTTTNHAADPGNHTKPPETIFLQLGNLTLSWTESFLLVKVNPKRIFHKAGLSIQNPGFPKNIMFIINLLRIQPQHIETTLSIPKCIVLRSQGLKTVHALG